MKLPYTPLQVAASACGGGRRARRVACGHAGRVLLAAQPGRAGVRRDRRRRPRRLPPVPGGRASRLALGRRARAQGARADRGRRRRGACVDGDVACVSIASALAWAAGRGFAVAVCAIGPGIVGTGSPLGHGGVAAAEAANAAAALGGRPVARRPRVGRRCSRAAPGRLASHACRARPVPGRRRVAWPKGVDAPDWLHPRGGRRLRLAGACAGLPLQHMGRGPMTIPSFFAAATRLAAGPERLGAGAAPSDAAAMSRVGRRPFDCGHDFALAGASARAIVERQAGVACDRADRATTRNAAPSAGFDARRAAGLVGMRPARSKHGKSVLVDSA